MAEEHALQAPTTELALPTAAQAVRLATRMGQIELHAEWPLLSRLPLRMTAGIKLPRFKVKDLLALRVESVVQTTTISTGDVPLNCGDTQLGWAEFELMGQKLAVRITRLV